MIAETMTNISDPSCNKQELSFKFAETFVLEGEHWRQAQTLRNVGGSMDAFEYSSVVPK